MSELFNSDFLNEASGEEKIKTAEELQLIGVNYCFSGEIKTRPSGFWVHPAAPAGPSLFSTDPHVGSGVGSRQPSVSRAANRTKHSTNRGVSEPVTV